MLANNGRTEPFLISRKTLINGFSIKILEPTSVRIAYLPYVVLLYVRKSILIPFR